MAQPDHHRILATADELVRTGQRLADLLDPALEAPQPPVDGL
ncbi:MAG: hypothetical protein ACRDZ4_15350 [Egibacteraceae bacterium]